MFGPHICRECVDGFTRLNATKAMISVQNPETGERHDDVEHEGPMIVAPERHVMIVHRGHGEQVVIGPGQVISLCEGDVVRILKQPTG